MPVQTINPASENVIHEYEFESNSVLQNKLEAAHMAFQNRPNFDALEAALVGIEAEVEKHKQEYASLITQEMGKPITQALSELEKCKALCLYYRTHFKKFLKDEGFEIKSLKGFVTHQPLGIILGIMPWNFPFWQAFRFAIPTLLAGNSILLKHSENVQLTASAIESLFQKYLPEGLFQNLRISVEQTEKLIQESLIRGVSLTGSTRAGKRVASLAGAALKPCLLELGGSDPAIVLKGSPLQAVAETLINGRFTNAGQSCVSPKRILVEKSIENDFIHQMVSKMQTLVCSDPSEPTSQLGPVARIDLLENLERQVAASLSEGAVLELGGQRAKKVGYYYEPTLLTSVSPEATAFKEEVFGPVAVITSFENLEDGIRLANKTEFGLGASIFAPEDKISAATEIVRNQLDAGCCSVNDFVRSHPALPFGGTKSSGYGRELAKQGLLAFTNTKTVCVSQL